MGCCLSTGRENAQDGNNDNHSPNQPSLNYNNHQDAVIHRMESLQLVRPARSASRNSTRRHTQGTGHASSSPQNAIVGGHRTSRRQSRHLELAAQIEEEQGGLRFDQRLTRPLVAHTWVVMSPMTREQLMRAREEFFDTRVTGRPEVWGTLRLVVESIESGDIATAQEMLTASGITTPTGNLVHGAYDELGTRYDLPDYAIATPRNLLPTLPEVEKHAGIIEQSSELDHGAVDEEEQDIRKEGKGKTVVNPKVKQSRIIARLSDRGGVDIPIMFDPNEPVKNIIRKIMEQGKLNPEQYKVRAVYLGKLLDEHQSLPKQGWIEGHILNAMVARIL